MSRRLLAFLLSELKTVRVICPRPSCAAVTEVSIEQLGSRFSDRTPGCPLCRHEFVGVSAKDHEQHNPLARLSEAILAIQGDGKLNKPNVQIEFVLPDPSAD